MAITASESPVRLVVDARSVELRRRVGANAWVVLEDLLLCSTLGVPGQAMSRATVRALAERTGLSKDTVARSLQRLRKANAFTVETERHDDSGRFVSVRYLVDLTTLPIELLTTERAVDPVPARPLRRTGTSPEQLSMLG